MRAGKRSAAPPWSIGWSEPGRLHLCRWYGHRFQSGAAGFCQVGMAEPHGHRTFADCRGRAPDGPAADVADGEDPRQAGLEQERITRRALPRRGTLDGETGRDETLLVES